MLDSNRLPEFCFADQGAGQKNQKVVFRIRHFLTDSLRNGSGHIGCTIRKDCRGKGLGTRGLELALKAADKLVEEDELYLRCQIDNAASLRMMLKNGASIHHSDGDHIFTRIPKKK